MVEGQEDLPANCVNIIEANSYCEWRGMRLPTPLEFDYAYRSGRSDYRFPWGKDDSECRAFGSRKLLCLDQLERPALTYNGMRWGYNHARVPCSFLEVRGVSQQGICDLAGNRREFALNEGDLGDASRHYALGGDYAQLAKDIAFGSPPGDSSIGFRCVDTVTEDGGQR